MWITLMLIPAFANASIEWHKWEPESFEKAAHENKMLLVNVGIEVCFACRWMEEGTYQKHDVTKLVSDHFIAIQVDAIERPDLGERYSDWAWPATIFMAPDGTQILALRGSRRPRNFIPILNKLIEQHKSESYSVDKMAPYAAPPKPQTTKLTVLRDRVRNHLDKDYDDIEGGWGDELKEIDGAGRLEQLFIRAVVENDAQSKQRALQTAEAMMGRMDPVWGGSYAAGYKGWHEAIPEKRTGALATSMLTFAYAYELSLDKRFLHAASEVDRYLRNWMLDDDGSFYTSQEDKAPNLPKNMSPIEYFNLKTDKERRQFGVPPIDHAVYTDLNARLITAYTRLYLASGHNTYLKTAERAAKTLLKTRLQPQGWIQQLKSINKLDQDKRIHRLNQTSRPLLRSQVEMGMALLSLHEATGDQYWLNASVKLADAIHEQLEDPVLGGFFSTIKDGTEHIVGRRKPLEDNGIAARFLYVLSRYTKNSAYEESAKNAIQASVSETILRREGRIIGNFATALEIITAGYLEFSIIGDAKDRKAKSLFNASSKIFNPRKIQHYERPGRYPDLGYPAVYICSINACSKPLTSAFEIEKEANKFIQKIDH